MPPSNEGLSQSLLIESNLQGRIKTTYIYDTVRDHDFATSTWKRGCGGGGGVRGFLKLFTCLWILVFLNYRYFVEIFANGE